MLNLLRLSRITANTDFEVKAAKIGQAFSGEVLGAPAGFTLMVSAVDFAVGPSYEIVIVGDPDASDTQTMVQAIFDQFIPRVFLRYEPVIRLEIFATHFFQPSAQSGTDQFLLTLTQIDAAFLIYQLAETLEVYV